MITGTAAGLELADAVTIRGRLGSGVHPRGGFDVFAVSSPMPVTHPEPVISCFAIVMREASVAPAVMTVMALRIGNRDPVVNFVYADPQVRGRAGGEISLPVAAGVLLYELGVIAGHSDERTDSGERWAKAVAHALGRPAPALAERRGDSERQALRGRAILEVINTADWAAAQGAG